MTEQEINRAKELIHARDEIAEFLSARDENSELVQAYLASQYDFQVREGKRLPKALYVEVQITDADSLEEQDADTLYYWRLPRDLVERALRAELDRIQQDLKDLRVEADRP